MRAGVKMTNSRWVGFILHHNRRLLPYLVFPALLSSSLLTEAA